MNDVMCQVILQLRLTLSTFMHVLCIDANHLHTYHSKLIMKHVTTVLWLVG